MDLQALLIGIDRYDPNPWCEDLHGAVADVEAMRAFLLDCGVPPLNVRCLVSRRSSAESSVAVETSELPTYDTMVGAITELGDRAVMSGSGALIHFSGHGGQARTWLPEVKGAGGLDEGLVPCDVCEERARLLRDVELTWLFDGMACRGVPVTVILDACHAGGMLRCARSLRRRSARKLLGDLVPREKPVAPLDELERVWRWVHHRTLTTLKDSPDENRRHGRAHSGWVASSLLERRGVIVVSACRSHEFAFERDFGNGPRGALTYCLLETLARDGRERSWEVIHRHLAHRLRRLSPPQRPIFEGDIGTTGTGLLALPALRASEERPTSVTMPSETMIPQAIRRRVSLVVKEGCPRQARRGGRRLELLRQELSQRRSDLLEIVDGDTAVPDFQVCCGVEGFEILWADGRPVPGVPLCVRASPAAAQRCFDILLHLAHFLALRDLGAPEQGVELPGALTVEMGLLPPGYRRGDPLVVEPLGGCPRIPVGRWIALDIANHGRRPLHFVVFDLRPDWGIEILHPQRGVAALERGQQLRLPFEVYLPPGHPGGAEILRTIATHEPVILEELRRPALEVEDEDASPPAWRRSRTGRDLHNLATVSESIHARMPARDTSARTWFGSRGRRSSPVWHTAQVGFEVVW